MLQFSTWKTLVVVGLSLLGVLYALPNVLPFMRSWPQPLPHKALNLGLDLQGGSYLLYEMNSDEIERDWLDKIRDEALGKLRSARPRIAYGSVLVKHREGLVEVHVRKTEDYERAYQELRGLVQNIGGNVFTGSGGADLEVTRTGTDVITLKPTLEALTQRIDSAVGTSIETIRRRIDQLGTTEPIIQRQGRNRILVQVPGFDDPKKLKAIVGKTAKLSFHEVYMGKTAEEAKLSGRPPGTIIVGKDPRDKFGPAEYLLVKVPVVDGEDLVDAQPGFDQQTNEPIVSFRFNAQGGRRFAKFTQDHVNDPFAIVLDNGFDETTKKRDIHVISAPAIREPILGGSGQISGNFSLDEVNELSILLRSGALPATLTTVEERSVGASLGADSIAAGKFAAIVGTVGVVMSMILMYGTFGVFAVLALVINIALLIGVLSLLQATLTLPGIAGIVLTVGMAVDANVIIYERIKEEIRAGKTAINAIETGFDRALTAVVDANLTTLIIGIILFSLASGPVRGFAVTLSLGIITSVFGAYMVNRLIIYVWLKGQSSRKLEVPI